MLIPPVKKLHAKKPHAKPHALTLKPSEPPLAPATKLTKKTALKVKILKVIPAASSRIAPPPQAKESVKPLELAIISAAPFQYLTKQKNVKIFAVSMRDLEYQLNKAEKPIIDPVTVVPECYHEFLDVFSKKALDKVLLHSKYNHKIKPLENDKDYG